MSAKPTLRLYRDADEGAAIELWRRTWQDAYPAIDFTARLAWWGARWRGELVPAARITVGEVDGRMLGFVTVDLRTGYLDQIVVAPEAWGSGLADMLLQEAKRTSPMLDLHVNQDNARALRFYEKHGFAVSGEGTSMSGRPIYKMSWRRHA